ncbi:ABC transporter permease [Granulicoccus sp. GXG6511]|uniref:ABC transporter permease n=1 Tax=Granulicoccus sp. GXG6511 TaxID=3381351 RepID=UPI003D7C980B
MNATAALLRNEARLFARTPGGVIPVFLPVLAALIIAAIPAARRPVDVMGGLSVSAAYTPTLILFAMTMAALVVLPQMLGSYRELGFLRRLRTTPTSPAALLAAYVIVTAVLSSIVSVVIAAGPRLFGAPAIQRPLSFAAAVIVALLPFLALGLMLCAIIPNPKAAAGIGNVVAAVMWFVAGMWFPRAQFPDWLLTLSDLLPGGAAATLMTDAMVGAPISWQAVAVCLAWAVLGTVVAVRTFRWE